jgi:hypothetical protein
MVQRKVKKRLIEPKVRLLLWVCLYGVRDESNWLAKLADRMDYSEGSLWTQLTDLLDKKLIESLNPETNGPPYKVTEEGKKFLQPILFTRNIGIVVSIWVGIWTIIYFLACLNQPYLMIIYWLPLLLVSFAILALVLIFYPHLLLKLGKVSY